MKINKKQIGIIAVVLLLLCAMLSVYLVLYVESIKIKEDAVYQINGIDYQVKAGDKAVKEKDAVVIEREKEPAVETDSFPLYYKDSQGIMLIKAMTYYKTVQESQIFIYRLNYFTDVRYKDGVTVFERGSKKSEDKEGFLFDGKDTYIFMQPVTVYFNDKEVALSPLSCAVVYNNNWIQIYDSRTKEYWYEEIFEERVSADCQEGNYRIMMDNDVLLHGQQEYMLHANVDNFNNYL